MWLYQCEYRETVRKTFSALLPRLVLIYRPFLPWKVAISGLRELRSLNMCFLLYNMWWWCKYLVILIEFTHAFMYKFCKLYLEFTCSILMMCCKWKHIAVQIFKINTVVFLYRMCITVHSVFQSLLKMESKYIFINEVPEVLEPDWIPNVLQSLINCYSLHPLSLTAYSQCSEMREGGLFFISVLA